MSDYTSNTSDAYSSFYTAEELLKIEQLCCFLQGTDLVVDDFAVRNKDCDMLGVISYYTDIDEYVFVPTGPAGGD
jgi:hypothetical protein